MPELCRFLGVVIQLHPRDHAPPHFHAVYGDTEALIDITHITVIGGRLPPRIEREVLAWAHARQPELREAWNRVRRREPVEKIAPPD